MAEQNTENIIDKGVNAQAGISSVPTCLEFPDPFEGNSELYQTRAITNIAGDFSLLQCRVIDTVVESLQGNIKDLSFNNKRPDQLDIFNGPNSKDLIEMRFKLSDFGVPRQKYENLRIAILSLTDIPVQFKNDDPDGSVWSNSTKLLAGVAWKTGKRRKVWDAETGQFVNAGKVEDIPGYRQRDLILTFRKEILQAFILEKDNGYVKYFKEVARGLLSAYSNRMYKLISSWVSDDKPYHLVELEELRKQLGLNDHIRIEPIYDDNGAVIAVNHKREKAEKKRIYENIRDLKRRALDKAKEELEEKADVYFDYELCGKNAKKTTNKAATHVKFFVKTKLTEPVMVDFKQMVYNMLSIIYVGDNNLINKLSSIVTDDNALAINTAINEEYQVILSLSSKRNNANSIATVKQRLVERILKYKSINIK